MSDGCRGDSRVARSSGDVSATEIDRLRQSLSVFLSPEKEKRKKRKSCKGDAPLTPAEGSDTTTVCGSSGEGSVQVAQCGQGGVQVIKRSAANTFFGFPSKGRLSRVVPRGQLTNGFCPEYGNFFRCAPRLCRLSPPACPFPGGLGGRSRIEPRLLISSLSAGANRGSLRGAVP